MACGACGLRLVGGKRTRKVRKSKTKKTRGRGRSRK